MEMTPSGLCGVPARSIGLSQAPPASSPRGSAAWQNKWAQSPPTVCKSPPAVFLDWRDMLGALGATHCGGGAQSPHKAYFTGWFHSQIRGTSSRVMELKRSGKASTSGTGHGYGTTLG